MKNKSETLSLQLRPPVARRKSSIEKKKSILSLNVIHCDTNTTLDNFFILMLNSEKYLSIAIKKKLKN